MPSVTATDREARADRNNTPGAISMVRVTRAAVNSMVRPEDRVVASMASSVVAHAVIAEIMAHRRTCVGKAGTVIVKGLRPTCADKAVTVILKVPRRTCADKVGTAIAKGLRRTCVDKTAATTRVDRVAAMATSTDVRRVRTSMK